MEAYYLIRNGSPEEAFELREAKETPPSKNQIGIQVSGFGLNFADVMARQGLYRDCPPLPAVIGYDVEGTIKALGSEVTGFQIGDKVFAMSRFGGYARYVNTDYRGVAKLPDSATPGQGAAMATQYSTAYYAAEYVQTLTPGDKVLIHAAAGGVGTALVQLCKRRKCVIFGTAGSPDKMEYLKSLGVDHPINYRQDDFAQVVESIVGKHALHSYFDNLGGKSIQTGKKLLAPTGRILSYGAASMTGRKSTINLLKLAFGFGLFSPIAFLSQSQALIGINMLRVADYRPEILASCLNDLSNLFEKGEISPTVGKVYPAADLAAAHAYLESRKSIGKIFLEWES